MILDTLHVDNALKIEHSEQNNSTATDQQAIGATTAARSLPVTPSDSNAVFVSKSGNDTTGNGTQANPYKTILQAGSACTADKQTVVIMDGGEYATEQITMSGNFKNLISASGYIPTIKPVSDSFNLITAPRSIITQILGTSSDGYTSSSTIITQGRFVRLRNGNHLVVYICQTASSTYAVRGKVFNSDLTELISIHTYFTSSETTLNIGENRYIVLDDVVVLWVCGESGFERHKLIIYNDGTIASHTQQTTTCTVYNLYIRRISLNKYYEAYTETYNSAVSVAWGRIYDGLTLAWSFPTALKNPWCHGVLDGYAHLFISTYVSGTTYTYTFYKVDILNYTVTSREVTFDQYTNPYAASLGNGTKFYKFNNKYYTIYQANWGTSDYGDWGIFEMNPADYTRIGNTYMFYASCTARGYTRSGYQYSFNVDNFIQIDDRYMLVWTPGASTTHYCTLLDMSLFDSSVSNSYTWILSSLDLTTTYLPSPGYYRCPLINPDYSLTFTRVTKSMSSGTYVDGSSVKLAFLQVFRNSIVESSVASVISGIQFDADRLANLSYIIKATGSLEVAHCDMLNHYDATQNKYFDSYALIATGATVIHNSKIKQSGGGINVANNAVSIYNTVISRCITGDAVKITGAGAGIVLNHITVYANYAGMRLVGNAGTEIIKNCVIQDNAAYGVKATTTLEIINSCCPDSVDTVTLDADTCTVFNPLFVNGGTENTDLEDLHLQSKAAGYTQDSPAKGIGNDSKDAGCYDVLYDINADTWSSFYVPKPPKIKPNILPVNDIMNTMQDGSIDTSVDAYQLKFEMEWSGLGKKYIKNMLKMITAGGNVRIYFNPYTDPFNFELVKLVPKDLPINNDLYQLLQYGCNGMKLEFMRKFNPEELYV